MNLKNILENKLKKKSTKVVLPKKKKYFLEIYTREFIPATDVILNLMNLKNSEQKIG